MPSPFLSASSQLSAALLLGSLLAMGCAVPSSTDGREATEGTSPPATTSTANGIVVVERSSGPGDATRPDTIVARFVRAKVGSVDEQALRIAGVAHDVPALGTCATEVSDAPSVTRGRDELVLLHVGPLSLSSSLDVNTRADDQAKSTLLHPRTMPDPAGLISGVFYSARSPEIFAPGARLQLRAAGGRDLPEGFVVNLAAPRDVGDIHVTPAAAGLDVTWEASDDVSDTVFVDVMSASARLVARCAAADVGRLTVPVLELGGVDEGQVAVHRLHREPFRAKGVDPGEIRFDLARVVTFRR